MKITAIEAIPLAVPLRPLSPPSPWTAWLNKQVIVRVRTDDGVTGLGEAFPYGAPLGVCSVIGEALAPVLRGEDPTRIARCVELMQRSTVNYARRGLGMFAISGVEIALWDLLGRVRQAPVHELLGGALRLRVHAYASLMAYRSPEDVATACRAYVEQGFGMLKLHQVDTASVRAAREAVGPTVELMLDTNAPWTPAEALARARELEPYRLFWLEEPVWPPEDYEGLAAVRRGAPMPIASGENEATSFGFRDLIARGAADVLQPSVTKVGGIGEFRKVATLAAAANLPVVPHAFYYGPGLAASLHLAATLGGTMPIEFPTGEHEVPLLATPITPRDGWLDVPDGPGLGVELNEDVVRRFPYAAAGSQPFVLR